MERGDRRIAGRHGLGRSGEQLYRPRLHIASRHDLIGRDFVLFAGPRGGAWIEAARRSAEGGAPLDCFRLDVDVDDPSATFLDKVGLGADGALLARPDGYIAWRSPSEDEDPSRVLENVLARICCLPVGAIGATPKALAAEHRR